uniref:Uncharacterized protein n=1 Tax=Cacopsylla melanoneura TaxID=428564 RepID=A0A8D8UV65_9HEMI
MKRLKRKQKEKKNRLSLKIRRPSFLSLVKIPSIHNISTAHIHLPPSFRAKLSTHRFSTFLWWSPSPFSPPHLHALNYFPYVVSSLLSTCPCHCSLLSWIFFHTSVTLILFSSSVVSRRTRNLEIGGSSPTSDIK